MTIVTEKVYKRGTDLPGRLFKVSSRKGGVDMMAATLVTLVLVDASAGPPGCFGVIQTFTTTAAVGPQLVGGRCAHTLCLRPS
jgi:hypothetical protein